MKRNSSKYLARNISIIAVSGGILIIIIVGLGEHLSFLTLLELTFIGIAAGIPLVLLFSWIADKYIFPQLFGGLSILGSTQVPQVSKEMRMHFEYELTSGEVVILEKYLNQQNSRRIRAMRSVVLAGIIALFFGIAAVIIISGSHAMPLLIFVIAILVLLNYLFLPSLIRKPAEKMNNIIIDSVNNRIGRHEINLSPQGIADTFQGRVNTTKWQSVKYIEETDEHLVISAIGLTYVIPEAAFSSSQAPEAFVNFVRAYCQC